MSKLPFAYPPFPAFGQALEAHVDALQVAARVARDECADTAAGPVAGYSQPCRHEDVSAANIAGRIKVECHGCGRQWAIDTREGR